MKTTSCRGCGAQIGFVKNEAGKYFPVDPDLVTPEDIDVLRGTLITEDGILIRFTPDDAEFVEPAYVPHWTTCPNAKEFRKAKTKPHDAEPAVSRRKSRG